MKTTMTRVLILVAAALLPAFPLRSSGATNYVIPGTNFQAVIDASMPGDTLVVQDGVYPDTLNFNKPLTVLRSGTNQILFTGTVRVQGAGDRYFSYCDFSSSVTNQCDGASSFFRSRFLSALISHSGTLLMSQTDCSNTVSVQLTSGSQTNFEAFDTTFANALSIAGGKTVLKRCLLAGLTLSSNAALESLRMTNSAATSGTAAINSGTPFVAVQSSFDGLGLSGYKVWLGYSSVGSSSGFAVAGAVLSDCDAVLVGNVVGLSLFRFGGTLTGIYVQRGTVKAYNNIVSLSADNNYGGGSRSLRGLHLTMAAAELANNSIYASFDCPNSGPAGTVHGLFVDGGGPVTLRANQVSVGSSSSFRDQISGGAFVSAGEPMLSISFCILNTSGGTFAPLSPVVPTVGCIINGSELAYIDGGPPEAIYADRDGTRNNIGIIGGPLYNAANHTNSNPMVFFLTGTPQTVFKGRQTNILVNVAATAGH